MKYTITINQKACVEAGLSLDIIDLAILDVLVAFSNSHKCQTKIISNNTFYLFNWKLIVSELPVIGLQGRTAIHNRFKKLIENQVIVPCATNQKDGKAFFCFGKNYDLLYSDLFTSVNTPVHEDEHNNNTIYNTNNNTIYNYRVYYDEQLQNVTEENKPFLEAYKAFIEYLFGNNEFKQPFKDFLKVERQLSLDEFKSLSEKSRNGLGWILVKMLNKPSYIKGKKSIYLTLNDWIERDNRNNKTEQQ